MYCDDDWSPGFHFKSFPHSGLRGGSGQLNTHIDDCCCFILAVAICLGWTTTPKSHERVTVNLDVFLSGRAALVVLVSPKTLPSPGIIDQCQFAWLRPTDDTCTDRALGVPTTAPARHDVALNLTMPIEAQSPSDAGSLPPCWFL